MVINGSNQAGQEDQELQVVLRVVTRLEEVLVVGAQRPVIVLSGAVHVVEGLLVLQAHQAMVRSDELHLLHGEKVIVDCE